VTPLVKPISCNRSGPRFGDQHVAGDNRHAAFELREGTGHPRIHRQHHAIGDHRAMRRLQACRAPFFQSGHGGVFVNFHAQLQRHPTQATHQFARLHTGRCRREPAFQMLARTGHALHIGERALGERVDAVALQCGDHRIGRADLRAVGRGVQRAVEAVVGIDAVLLTELADRMDAAFRFLDQTYRFFDAKQALKGEIFRRPRQRTTAVAAAGAGAADVRFDQQHIEFGVLLLEHDRRPQPGVAAANDAHIVRTSPCNGGQVSEVSACKACSSQNGLMFFSSQLATTQPAASAAAGREAKGFRNAGV
jgi:hypothetical protein